MRTGDVVQAKLIRRVFKTETLSGYETYKAPNGEQFVFLLLGAEPTDGPPLDPKEALKALGWVPTGGPP